MTRAEIDKIFGLMVKEYLDKGYAINTDSMRGMQGEIAKVDLIKDGELIRVWLGKGCDYKRHYTDTYVLVVGRYTKEIIPGWTYWDDDFEDIERDVIYQIGKDWYSGNEEYIRDCFQRRNARRMNSYTHYDQYECKSAKLSDIGKVWRNRENGYVEYFASVRDETRKICRVLTA